jgi:hypothetical protein
MKEMTLSKVKADKGLPGKLQAQGVNPEIPWLYGYKLDFRFL